VFSLSTVKMEMKSQMISWEEFLWPFSLFFGERVFRLKGSFYIFIFCVLNMYLDS
jgi:hypothetical protein